MRFGTVILAAGASARMGRPKLLLPWHDKTILRHMVEQWMALGSAQIAAVVERDSQVDTALNEFPFIERIVNPYPEHGMFSSVQCAAKWRGWKEDLTHVAITLGDQPQVKMATLQNIINFARENPGYICQPARKGRGRHPVVLPCQYLFELPGAAEAHLKQFLQGREQARKLLELDDEGLDVDLDTMADYEQAIRSFPFR